MDKKNITASKIAELAGKVVTLLEPLSSEDRHKVVNASLTLLGEPSSGRATGSGSSGLGKETPGEDDKSHQDEGDLPSKAKIWMKQNGLGLPQIEAVFDITSEGAPVIISDVPGKGKKEKTHNVYVLQGVSRLLASGEVTFDDKEARKLCDDLGCSDKANHAAIMADKGNVLTGSKGAGWKLTAPGLKHGAELVKQLTSGG